MPMFSLDKNITSPDTSDKSIKVKRINHECILNIHIDTQPLQFNNMRGC